MKNVIVFAILALTSLSAISQSGYPKLQIINGDSVVSLTLSQTIKVNETRVNLLECREVLYNMTTQALILDSLHDAQARVVRSLILELNIVEDMNDNRMGIIDNLQADLGKARRKIKVQKLLRWGGVFGGLAIGFLVPRVLGI